MKPNPLASLNHFTVPCSIGSTECIQRYLRNTIYTSGTSAFRNDSMDVSLALRDLDRNGDEMGGHDAAKCGGLARLER